MKAVKKILGIGLISVAVLSLSGCGLIPQSDEQRYRLINEVKDSLDYASAGEVIREGYDDNNGVFSPSVFAAQIKGTQAFSVMKERVQSIPNVECSALLPEEVRCNSGQVIIEVTLSTSSDSIVNLRLTDVYSGRNPNGDG